MGELLTWENGTEGRWKKYFVQLLNGDEIREVGGDVRRERVGENERVVRELMREEIMGTLKKMRSSKKPGLDGIMVKILKNGGISIIDWLLRIINRCMESGVVPEYWNAACIVLVYKGKSCRSDCANYRVITIFSKSGKIYERVWISREMKVQKTCSGRAMRI